MKGPVPIGVRRSGGRDAGGDVAGLQCAVRLHPLLVEDVDAGKIVQEKRVGAVGDDIDGEVVDFLGPDHGRDVAAGAGAGIEQARDRGHHVIGREGIAVVELDVLAQLEAPGVRLHVLPAHRQGGLQLQIAAAAHQRVEHMVQHAGREALRMRIGVKRRDVGRRGPPEGLRLDGGAHRARHGETVRVTASSLSSMSLPKPLDFDYWIQCQQKLAYRIFAVNLRRGSELRIFAAIRLRGRLPRHARQLR